VQASIPIIADDLGWAVEDTRKVWIEIENSKKAIADWGARLIYMTSTWRQECNLPDNPNVCIAWRRELDELPRCGLLARYEQDATEALARRGDRWVAAFRRQTATTPGGTGKGSGKGYGKGFREEFGNTEDRDRDLEEERSKPPCAGAHGPSDQPDQQEKAPGGNGKSRTALSLIPPESNPQAPARDATKAKGQSHSQKFISAALDVLRVERPGYVVTGPDRGQAKHLAATLSDEQLAEVPERTRRMCTHPLHGRNSSIDVLARFWNSFGPDAETLSPPGARARANGYRAPPGDDEGPLRSREIDPAAIRPRA
jgi:hypothetical protein